MAYFAPTIGPAGFSAPTYIDIRDFLNSSYLTIWGQSASVDVATPDYEQNALYALMFADAIGAMRLCYQNRGPGSAIGAGLDGIVQCNGLTRLGSTYSTATLNLVGTPNVVINNGLVLDENGFTWALPNFVQFSNGGTAMVTATCTTAGAVAAGIGTITFPSPAQSGWTSATNASPAIPGANVELDWQLRERQSVSVQGPSLSPIGALIGAVAAVPGVTRYNVLENPTGSIDQFGNPPHSISVVAEGGLDIDIATAMYLKKTPGALTNGGTNPVAITVLSSASNSQNVMSFQRPMPVPIYVVVDLKPLIGYTTATAAAIQSALFTFLNGLQIGQTVYMSDLFGAALAVNLSLASPVFAIRNVFLGTTANPATSGDITLSYFQVAAGLIPNISIVQVS